MNVGSLVEFLEDVLRSHVPVYAAPPLRWAVDWRSLADKFAMSRLPGFVDATTLYSARGDGLVVRLRHECGAWCMFDVEHIEFATRPGPDAARAFGDIIRARAACYCVPREVVVPCTARRCE